jgi:quercetin dioxygenase-like cupin family protein
VLRAGDVFHEPEGVPVRFDATDEGATFLGYFLLSDGQDPEISMRA